MNIEITSLEQMIQEFKEFGFNLTVGSSQRSGKPTAMAMRIVSKSRYPKPYFNYVFNSEERRRSVFTRTVKQFEKQESGKGKESRSEKGNQEKHGEPLSSWTDIYYDSWGYEQTNIDFYQVVGVTEKSVVIRRIAGKAVEGKSEGLQPDEWLC
jgi:hypothetical protein